MGYTVGFREDGSFQADAYPNANAPILFLDNEFRDPDLDRMLDTVAEHRPTVAVLGDAYDSQQATTLQDAADELETTYDDIEPIIVPKCAEALDTIDSDTVVGYANGYSDVKPSDFSDLHEWRDRRIHVLGGSPPSQLHVVDQLTQPTLHDDPPADIIGLDTNVYAKVAYKGEYWSPDGWQPADHLSIRDTVRRSLDEAKQFYQDRGVWPDHEPVDEFGPAVVKPDLPLFYDDGGTPIASREELESAYIGEYGGETVAFRSAAHKRFLEYRDEFADH